MIRGFTRRIFETTADGQRGSALLVVLVMLGLIAALASVIARSVSGAALTLGAARGAWQSEADLRAGIELGAATILKFGEDLRSAEASVDLTGRRIAVRVTNERARIDLNAASGPVLAQLLESNGVLDSEAAALAASVIEWRRGSSAQPLIPPLQEDHSSPSFSGSGTISPEPGAGPEQGKEIRHFFHPWQLASVPGFSAPLVNAILPLVTVANASDQIDPYIAADRVLKALPGASPGSVDAFLEARDGNTGREAAILLLGVPKTLLTAEPAPGWRIEVSTHLHDGRIRRSEAVIAILSGDSEPYRVLYVLDDQEQPSP
jgi:general secretion pathway protein K